MSDVKSKPKVDHVKWSDKYSMGIKLIDKQHMWLINFVNALFTHATGNEHLERKYFQKVIQKAVQYVHIHFETEEKYMLATKFPGYEEHKQAHDDFVQKIIFTVKSYKAGKKLVLENFAIFLRDWLVSHVAIMDKQYSIYFKEIATRKEDGKLSIKLTDIK